ncbi:DNA polymerase III subunit delta [Wenzhouxiangella sp. AB-CW3]|uniref:DNA polymerase III subunit delta n=1 Tax=Wenzhouxiangella sp. AB-CW3 TaxID=2771012 RepID=UPI00168B72E4|nr:DNA polymerase III subunit delta [Wenzhouxiangella sp. AB-CW3]QOC22103.1 DNA polymerase III subunit delta [Wenzhouxiangella sp. AB-CW3]
MKLFPDKLSTRLEREIDPVYLVAGQEALSIEECCDAIRQAARRAEIAERIVLEADGRFDWSQLESSTETHSLFATRRLIEVRLPTGKPGREGGAALRAFVERGGDDVILVKCDEWDMKSERSAWVKALDGAGVYVPCWKIKPHQLPDWITRRLAARGLRADRATATFLAERLEGNLLAAAQEIERLGLLFGAGPIALEQVREAVADNARFDSFRLVELVLAGQPGAAVRSIRGLREAETAMPLIVGALARELQGIAAFQALTRHMSPAQAFSELGVWKSRQQPLMAASRRLQPDIVRQAQSRLADLDAMSKSSRQGEFWVALERLCVGLATNRAGMCAA